MILKNYNLAIVGLGYVGLPLAVSFSYKRNTIGFDINEDRIKELRDNLDRTNEVSKKSLENSDLFLTSSESDLKDCNFFIVTVPTPIDKNKKPDLSYLESASKIVGKYLTKGSIVVYESTVYPGATEEICIPLLESISKLVFNEDFYVGYSPERINPGDKEHTLETLIKVVSGSTPEATETINKIYLEVVKAGTHIAPSIKVAEAAKVIENTQRDLNIALINELVLLFHDMGLNSNAVLEAANTKWNFLDFKPGLVGGHCIGVDPYYLTHKAIEIGFNPEIILAGRRTNDSMPNKICDHFIQKMINKELNIHNASVLILGLTFKENCPDTRNSKVFDVINNLHAQDIKIDVFDPFINSLPDSLINKANLINAPKKEFYDGLIVAVGHEHFKRMGDEELLSFCKTDRVIYDLKNIIHDSSVDLRL